MCTEKLNTSNSIVEKNLLECTGRVGRLGYFFSILAYLVFTSVNPVRELQAFVAIFFLGIVFFIGIKRCHDLGHSGWWQLIPFYFVWMLFAPGEKKNNQYGPA
ncbi:MAG: DUF805 domain-containing protein [Bacteroidaceae bacterium]|nr:DUF805 domain-containing protein [Bacteroidaceae bacterium]